MRDARGCFLLLVAAALFFCSFLLPTAHDDEIENGPVGKIAGAVLALVPMIFLGADTRQTDEDNLTRYACLPRSCILDVDVFYATNQLLIRCFLLWPDKHAAPALRAGRRLDNTTYSAIYVSEHQV
jgi:hypothetical protein